MANVFGAVTAIAVGLGLLIFRARLALYIVTGQNRFWGPDFLSNHDVRISEVVIVIIGIGSVCIGLVVLTREMV